MNEKPFNLAAWILARELAQIDEDADCAQNPEFNYFYDVLTNDT